MENKGVRRNLLQIKDVSSSSFDSNGLMGTECRKARLRLAAGPSGLYFYYSGLGEIVGQEGAGIREQPLGANHALVASVGSQKASRLKFAICWEWRSLRLQLRSSARQSGAVLGPDSRFAGLKCIYYFCTINVNCHDVLCILNLR